MQFERVPLASVLVVVAGAFLRFLIVVVVVNEDALVGGGHLSTASPQPLQNNLQQVLQVVSRPRGISHWTQRSQGEWMISETA